jgi:hypothetical protein
MSPLNRCSIFINRCLDCITASVVVLREKLGDGPADWSAGVPRIVSRALFLRSSRLRPTLLGQREKLPRTGTVHEKRMSDIFGPAQEAYVACVSGFPCRVYIDSNRRDSRI